MLTHFENARFENRLERILLTGEKNASVIVPHLQKLLNLEDIAFCDPFQNLDMELNDQAGALVQQSPEKFLVSLGMVCGGRE